MSSSKQSKYFIEKDLLEKLKSQDLIGIGDMFEEYLKKPFTRKNVKKERLYDRFKEFFKDSFLILDRRLLNLAELNKPNMVDEMFKVYRLCLDYLDKALPETSNFVKYWLPPRVHFMMRCFEAHKHVEEIETQGRALLMRLKPLNPPEEMYYLVLYIYTMLFKIAPKSTNEHLKSLFDQMEGQSRWIRSDCRTKRAHLALANEQLQFASNLWEEPSITNTYLKINFICAAFQEKMRHDIEAYKTATNICVSIFNMGNYEYYKHVETILTAIAPEDWVKDKTSTIEFLKVVNHCVKRCKDTNLCEKFGAYISALSKQLRKVSTMTDSILGLYIVGLVAYRRRKSPQPILEIFNKYYNEMLQKSFSHSCNLLASDWEASYIDALLFLCHMIATPIQWKQFVPKEGDDSDLTMLSNAQEMFHVLCQLITSNPSHISENKKGVCTVALTTFALSIRTKHKLQDSINFIEEIIKNTWIETNELRILSCDLNELAELLRENDLRNEASDALSLCCKALWVCLPCNMNFKEIVLEIYERSDQLLNIVNGISHHLMRKKLIEFLDKWSNVNDDSKTLPAPERIVKTWVKIHCKYVKDMNEIEIDEHDHPTLYCLFSSSAKLPDWKLSDRNIWTILTQELTAYERMSPEYQTICHKMERRIKRILLQLFTNPHRIEKEKTQRVHHIQDSAIECLTKAIQIMEKVSNVMRKSTEKNPVAHELYVAKCLEELCTRGDDSYLETGDVNITDCIMYLLENMFDFLQLKGFMESSNAVYSQLIRMHKLKGFSVDKQLTLLWETRRLSHVCCVSPMNEEFIQKLLDCSIDIKEIESCIRKLTGFKHHFFFLFSENSDEHDVPKYAHEPISTDPGRSYSIFVDGYRCLDLCQKLIANGQLIEALSSAKEAQRLHGKLFHTRFRQNVEKLNDEEHNLMVDFSKNLLEMNISIARDIFLFASLSRDSNDTYVSSWKIMQCYLESTLQVAIIHEMIGDGTEALTHLLMAESISMSLNLPLFGAVFSSHLGKLYAQQGLWESAKDRLTYFQDALNGRTFCCSLCKKVLQATLCKYYGDLWEMKSENTSKEKAVKSYKDGLNELDNNKWENPLSCPKDATKDPRCTCFKEDKNVMNKAEAETKGNHKRVRESGYNTRSTRAKPHSSQNESMTSKVTGSLVGNQVRSPSDILTQKESDLDQTCVFSKMRCWHNHSSEVVKPRPLNDFIALKWEFTRRKLSMKIRNRLVKCFANLDEMDEAQKILQRNISVLVARNPFRQTFSSIPLHHFCNLVAKEIPGDGFAIERAELLYVICWFCLKSYNSKSTSNIFCDPSSIKFECLASWLMQAFVLSREVPVVLQKVSKLLAIMYVVSATGKQYSLSSDIKALGENYWSSYFHQASIGTHLTCEFLSHLSGRCKGPNDSTFSCIRTLSIPKDTKDLKKHVESVLDDLPSTAIIGISVLNGDYNNLLQELLSCKSVVEAWMLVSRLSSKMEPMVILLPLDSILQDEVDMSTFSDTYDKCKEIIGDKRCPWRFGFAVVDHIAPAFGTIFKRNALSSSIKMQKMLNDQLLWQNLRNNLEGHFEKFLRTLEDLWLGSWKWLLLGEWVNCKNFDSVLDNLRSTSELDVNEVLVKIILGTSEYYKGETLVSDLCLKKDCYIAKVGHCDTVMSGIFLKAANGSRESYEVEVGQLSEALNMLEVGDSVEREPIILVLDYEVAMLPWESLPILKNQEVLSHAFT